MKTSIIISLLLTIAFTTQECNREITVSGKVLMIHVYIKQGTDTIL
jgi:hypothetical protein